MTRIKLSGVVRPEDADLAGRLGIDLLAVVFHAASPRYVDTQRVWDIRDALGGRAALVGVFSDAPLPIVQRLVDHCRLPYAQLFGAEPRAVVEAIRPAAFKAESVDSESALGSVVKTYGTRQAAGPERPGLLVNLTGALAGEWHVVSGPARRVSLLLASPGLTPETVGHAVAVARPWGVDVWDAVEEAPGRVDAGRLEAFVGAVREADGRLDPS
jgi:phosphoribosylanthranilate isomerase